MQGYFTIFTVIQFFFTVVIGLYFWNMLKKQRGNKKAVKKDSKKEMKKLSRLRSISLTEPLSEKTRPDKFEEIIGQKEGVEGLKAALCGPNPQHVIMYGPPGVGKTAAARLVLKEAKKNPRSPFDQNSDFIELDATTARFDERSIADPLIGSVHDPIYQGAGPMGAAGIPQPKPGAVTKAHGGMLFIDEIGELHPMQMNKLLKVLEDRKVFLDSAYYSESDSSIPRYIHDIFRRGLPADFRLVGATTRQPREIPPAIRSRCLEIYFSELTPEDIEKIACRAIDRIGFIATGGVYELIKDYASNGRETVNIIQLAGGMALKKNRKKIKKVDVERVLRSGRFTPRYQGQIPDTSQAGVVNGLAVKGANTGILLEIECAAIKSEAGAGNIKITGAIEEEEIGGKGRKIKRKSMARESAENALTVLRKVMEVDPCSYDIHINFPGGIPVDGPSAGLSMAVALYSCLMKKDVDNQAAVTGEVSIRGRVKSVGGIVPKVEAARKAGVKKVIIPEKNWQNLFYEYEELKVIPVKTLEQALESLLVEQEEEREQLITGSKFIHTS
ncbi:MAG: ATP-dependent protease LonB [Halanaerobiales bacterium]